MQELLLSVYSGNIGAVLEAGVKGQKSQCTSSKQSCGNSGSLESNTMSSHVKRPVPMKACGDVKTRIKTLIIKTIARWQVSYNIDYLLR